MILNERLFSKGQSGHLAQKADISDGTERTDTRGITDEMLPYPFWIDRGTSETSR
jgi:hypothetical protein